MFLLVKPALFAIKPLMASQTQTDFEELLNNTRDDLVSTGSIYQALLRLNEHLTPLGIRDIIYVYMLHAKSHIRNDYIFLSSFPDELGALFRQDGGGASYMFGDVLPRLKEPLFWDIEASQNPDHPFFSYNRANKFIYERGYRDAWLIPMDMRHLSGYGFMMIFQESRQGAPRLDVEQLSLIGPFYHDLMKKHGLTAGHFMLSEKQCVVLEGMAEGKTAADLAAILGIAQRSVELRLKNARLKLRARTTTEAVYKARAYGILPYRPPQGEE